MTDTKYCNIAAVNVSRTNFFGKSISSNRMVYVLLYIIKLIQIGYRSAYSKSNIKYNHSDLDVSKIYIIVKII